MKSTTLLAVLTLLSACEGSVEQQESHSKIVTIDTISTKATQGQPAIQASTSNAKALNDTLQVSSNVVLRVLPGSKNDFTKWPTKPKQEITEAFLIRQQANGRVRREGNRLLLTLDNGESIVFKNNTYRLRGDENEELDKYYQYRGNLPGLPYWVVEESLYEAWHTLLINQQTGIKTAVKGELKISPDHTRMLASYAGLVYDDDVSTLQLFAIKQQAALLLWQKNLPNWAPGRTCWLDDHTIAIEKMHLDSDSISATYSNYIRLVLP